MTHKNTCRKIHVTKSAAPSQSPDPNPVRLVLDELDWR